MPAWILDQFSGNSPGISIIVFQKSARPANLPAASKSPKGPTRWSDEGLRYFDDLADIVVAGAAVVLLLRKRTRTGIFMGVSDVVRSVRPSVRPSVRLTPKKGFPLCCEVHTCGTESPRHVRLLPLYHLSPSSTPSNTYGLRRGRRG